MCRAVLPVVPRSVKIEEAPEVSEVATEVAPTSTASVSESFVPKESSQIHNPSPLQLEVRWGRTRRIVDISKEGCTIGSTDSSDVVVPAPFLEPIHGKVEWVGNNWQIRPATKGAIVLARGVAVRSVELSAGDVIRLADQVGNFATLTVSKDKSHGQRTSALRGELPLAGRSVVIGSAAECDIRVAHPLVRPRHAILRRDDDGKLWLDDRTTVAGTYVNGKRLKGRVLVHSGDVIQVGPSSARIGSTSLEPLEQVRGVDVTVINACVEAEAKGKGRRRLLNDVNLHLPPASLTAVAGPSGAGKTTLMRLLSGQAAASAGVVEYNGVDLSVCREAHAALMGFVPQDDVVHQDLTVGEALTYQSRLRLGKEFSKEARDSSIVRALEFVGLEGQRDQIVKTLSGGQRKRVSISTELLNEPEILFLDEPTSGLDPGLDKRMMLLLRLLADQGRTVILTTHAISYVDVCDNLILVGPGGFVIYAGDPTEAPAWFGVPALSDVFSLVEDTASSSAAAQRWLANTSSPGKDQSGNRSIDARKSPVRVTADSSQLASGASGIARPKFGSPAWRETVFHQGAIFSERYVKILTRDRTALAFSLLQGIAVALLTALVAPKPIIWSQNGSAPMFVLGCASVWFGMINSVRELVKERTIWRREELAGANVAAYLASKLSVLGALALFQSLSAIVALDLALGLPPSSPVASPLIALVVSSWLANLCGMSLGLAVSALATSSDRAMSIVPYLLITQLVLCGVLFPLGVVTPFSWLIPARWGVSAMGGIAGLSASALHQSAGLYPSTFVGMVGTWLVLALLSAVGVAGTGRILHRQASNWSV
ncbi:MAG: ATP-binding cassette domain-containing protein [Acidimicrobiaceae bacterium]|nr:ATP-binding cassette domain-containing protein [Acidimicrobiaceae bacterium]